MCLTSVPIIHGQDLTTEACLNQTYTELSAAQRVFRSVVLGQAPANTLSIGAVRYDRQRRGWIRTAANTWKPLAAKNLSSQNDTQMDGNAEFPPRLGLIETRKARMSDLLPRILVAFRAFQCQTRAVCMAELESQREDAPNVLKVQPDGCIVFSIPRYDACRLAQPPAVEGGEPQKAYFGQTKISTCDDVRDKLIDHEMQMLRLIAAYDYRSFLQFAGTFDDFLTAFRQPLLLPMWQTVRMLKQLFEDRSCVNTQCDE